MENPNNLETIVLAAQIINKIPEKEGDMLIEFLAEKFTLEQLTQVSAFFHEACRVSNRNGITGFFSDFQGTDNGSN